MFLFTYFYNFTAFSPRESSMYILFFLDAFGSFSSLGIFVLEVIVCLITPAAALG